MRENIGLFKAKRIDNVEWVIGHYIPFGLDVNIHYDIVFSKGDYIFCSENQQLIEINIKTLCQYTGLKDKNGKMIFEGDILKEFYWDIPDKHSNIICHWGSKGFVFTKEYKWDYGNDKKNSYLSRRTFNVYRLKKCEIIGNRFDNPELLGDKV